MSPLACVFLGIGAFGVVLMVVAVRYGHSPADIARKLADGSGVRRVTARQLRHELRLARHELDGAGQYIGGLERDRRELSALLEHRGKALAEAANRIVALEADVADLAALRKENTRLHSALANATAVRPLAAPTAADASALPDGAQEYADQTTTAWRARA